MLDNIINKTDQLWKFTENKKHVTIVDDGFAELIKWQTNDKKDQNIEMDFFPIIDLSADIITKLDVNIIKSYNSKNIVFCLSFIDINILNKLQEYISISKALEIIIITTISPDLLKISLESMRNELQHRLQHQSNMFSPVNYDSFSAKDQDDLYELLYAYLQPTVVTVIYYPMYSFPILNRDNSIDSTNSIRNNNSNSGTSDNNKSSSNSSSSNNHINNINNNSNNSNKNHEIKIELYNTSSLHSRNLTPLTLHSLNMYKVNESVENISDISSADIPNEISKHLKFFSHDLAGQLVYDLAVDPVSIFVLGMHIVYRYYLSFLFYDLAVTLVQIAVLDILF